MADTGGKPFQHDPDKPWIFRTYAGHSTAEESNKLYRTNLAKGQTGLSVAFDLPTQTGYDSDHILARGEVGKVGVPVGHLGDMRALFDGIPLEDDEHLDDDQRAGGLAARALHRVAEEQGAPRKAQGTTQNDIIKEYLSRGTYIFPPKPSMRLIGDTIAYTVHAKPEMESDQRLLLPPAGSRRDAGAGDSPIALATAIAVLDTVKATPAQVPEKEFGDRGRRASPSSSMPASASSPRCARCARSSSCGTRSAASAMASRTPSRACFRYGVQVNSLGLTEPQPENNVYRILLEMLAVTLSKDARARAVQLPAWNEALGLPRPWDQQWSLRLQQILAYESDLLEYEDLFDGSSPPRPKR
jgi:(2R)-ethylmalonyl-CoA mutase